MRQLNLQEATRRAPCEGANHCSTFIKIGGLSYKHATIALARTTRPLTLDCEAELHQIKLRLHQGERQKAARGELRVPLPAGLGYGRDGRIGFNPDEEVHARLLHLFAKFRELRSAKAVMRHFQEANFLVPVRPLDGPSPPRGRTLSQCLAV